ncbi:MAG: DNA polymerase III subunit delta [Arcobacter sp.]|nr:DNA polymerase III subunit delta [Arcobacter sp.]
MYRNEFDKEFKKGISYSAYLFYGAENYLCEHYGEKVARFLANGEDINKLYFEEFGVEECLNILSQSSLFSSTNILLVKINKKIPKKELDKLIETCVKNSDSKIIFCCFGDADFKSMEASFTKKTNSVSVRFFPIEDYEAKQVLGEKASELGVQIAGHDLEFLYNMHQKDLGLSISDLSKLAILDESITSKTISLQCFGLGSVNIDEFLEKLVLGKNVNKDIYDLLEEGMDEIALIYRITSFVQTLFMINSYLKLYGNLNIMEIWGYPLPQKIAAKQAELATKFQKNDFANMLAFLQELELELKSGKVINVNTYFQARLRGFQK